MLKRIRTISLTAGFGVAILATMNMAQAQPHRQGPRDSNRGDAPFAKGMPDAEEIFSRLDQDKDGNVTLDEFKAGHARMQERFQRLFQKKRGKRPNGFGDQGPQSRGRGDAQPKRRPQRRYSQQDQGFGPRGQFGAGPRARGFAARGFMHKQMQRRFQGHPRFQRGFQGPFSERPDFQKRFHGQFGGGPRGFHPGFRQGPPRARDHQFDGFPQFPGRGGAQDLRGERAAGPERSQHSRMHRGEPEDRMTEAFQGRRGQRGRGYGPGPMAGAPRTPSGQQPGISGLGPRRPEGLDDASVRGPGHGDMGPARDLDQQGPGALRHPRGHAGGPVRGRDRDDARPNHGPGQMGDEAAMPQRGPEADQGPRGRGHERRPVRPNRPRGEDPRPNRPSDGDSAT